MTDAGGRAGGRDGGCLGGGGDGGRVVTGNCAVPCEKIILPCGLVAVACHICTHRAVWHGSPTGAGKREKACAHRQISRQRIVNTHLNSGSTRLCQADR